MKSCDNGHCHIEFDDHSCPVCDLQIEYAKKVYQLNKFKSTNPRRKRSKEDKERIKDLQKKNGVLRGKLKEIKSIVGGRI